MGGPGSGRWYRWKGTRTTLDEAYRLDVRWLHRHGYLDGRPLITLPVQPQPNRWPRGLVAFSPDRRTLAAATGKGLELWEVSRESTSATESATGAQVQVSSVGLFMIFPPVDGAITSVTFSPDGRILAAAGKTAFQ